VDSILDFSDIFIPACSTAAAVVALFWGRANVTRTGLRYHGGPMRPRLTGHGIIFRVA